MEIRRRNPETIKPSSSHGDEGSTLEEEAAPVEQSQGNCQNPLVERGLQLSEEAEQSGFRNVDSLQKSLECFIQAAENGVQDAGNWIGSFLSSIPALPPSVILPSSLVKVMQWVTRATDTEKQIRIVAKSMFSKMTGPENPTIPKSKIDERAQLLLASQSEHAHTPGLAKSAKELRSSVKRLLHSALLLSGSEEVCALVSVIYLTQE